MAFNEQKYKDIFEKRHGRGSFDAGLSFARSRGETQARAEYAKELYEKRKKKQNQPIRMLFLTGTSRKIKHCFVKKVQTVTPKIFVMIHN